MITGVASPPLPFSPPPNPRPLQTRTQLEIKEETTLAALALARRQGVLTVLNSAPAPASLPAALYELSDVFCANETEASTLTGACRLCV